MLQTLSLRENQGKTMPAENHKAAHHHNTSLPLTASDLDNLPEVLETFTE